MFELTRASLGVAVAALVLAGCKPPADESSVAAKTSGKGSTPVAAVGDDEGTAQAKPAASPAAGESTDAGGPARRTAPDVSRDLSAGGVSSLADQGEKIATTPGVVVSPGTLELGQIPTNDAAVGTVTLKNEGDTPRTLRKCTTSCGCTTTNCPEGEIIEPGGEVAVEIKLNGGTTARKLQKVVTFVVSDQAPIKLNVHGEAVSFVVMEPASLDPEVQTDGAFTLAAIDDEPFKVVSIYPPIVEGLPTEDAVTHELTLDWDRWRELGSQRKLLFTLDHSKSAKIYGSVKVPRSMAAASAGAGSALPGRVALDAMLKRGENARAIEMIESGDIDPRTVGTNRQLPLGTAAKAGALDVMQALLDASADIDGVDRTGKTALMWAAQSNSLEAVQLLLDAGADIKITDNIGSSALAWAAGFGDAPSVKELIEAGSAVDVPGAITGFTPLIWASGFGQAGAVQALVDAGANVGAADSVQGATPLMHAARTGRVDNARILIDAGANLEDRDATGKTVLLMAASNAGAGTDMVQLIIDAGADLTAVDNQENDALALADKRTDARSADVLALLKEVMGK